MKKNGSATLHIEYMPLTDLISRLDEANPKDHDLGALHTSMDKFGYVEIPVLNEATGKLVAGHGRIETLMQKKQSHMPAPARIDVRNDDWYVPVQRGVAFKNEREARAYLIASNRLTVLGGWHEAELAALLESLRSEDESLMHAAGYSDEDLEGLLRDLGQGILADTPQDAGAQLDKAAELQAKWQVQAGQVWEIPSKTVPGKAHRLICGDCTDENILKTLFEDVKFAVVFTDPPYGIKYDSVATGRSERQFDKIPNDDLEGQAFQDFNYRWISAALPFQTEDASYYVCGANRTAHHLILAAERLGLHYAVPLVWVKQHFALNWDRYHPQHEWIFYGGEGSKPTGKTSRWYGENNETTVWSIARDNAADYEHPTQKPVELPARAIRNSSASGEIIADFFLGSGTTLVASEQLGRICYGTEIHPPFFAVILDRMERMGLNPKLVSA